MALRLARVLAVGTLVGLVGGLAVVLSPAPAQAQEALLLGSSGQVLYRQHCASCHDAGPDQVASRAPLRDALAALPRERIVAALAPGGVMAEMAKSMTALERTTVAGVLSKAPATPAVDPDAGRCTTPARPLAEAAVLPQWNGWGNDLTNARFQTAAAAGLTAQSVPRLTLKWAFGVPGVVAMSGQPTVFAGRVVFGTEAGTVYALDAVTGCVRWRFDAGAAVRSAVVVGRLPGAGEPRYAAYFGDLRATMHALDLATGQPLWSLKVDDHAFARITGGAAFHDGRLFVPVSSLEELPGARPNYPCCTFRGSLVAIDATTGKQLWKTFTIPEAPQIVGRNAAGTPLWKPAGAAIWSSPTVDVARRVVYVATGNAYTQPAAATSDAVMALALDTGAVQWVQQVTPDDAFLVGCKPGNDNCPDDEGPDFDFGNSPILRRLANGRTVIVIGQKSGVAYGLDPDAKGAVLWRYRAGQGSALGGIEWGSAADERLMYVPVSDVLHANAGGLHAVSLGSGERVWQTAPPAPGCTGGLGCSAAQSAAVSVMPGVVFSGAVDGHLRAYDATDGRIIWDVNTARDYTTVNGEPASGGSIDGPGPTIAGGMVFTGSGYGRWRGRPGNVLLAFGLP
ncbi:MAG: PQQ-binding-like beta-propeller repeat protein [Vicinamibacterales bacterium]